MSKDIGSVAGINSSNDVVYHIDGGAIDAVSLTEHDKYRLFIGIPEGEVDIGEVCTVSLEGGYHYFKKDELKSLLVAWLCIVDPDCIKVDK